MLLKILFTSVLETAINQYLALDDKRGEFLAPLAGKVIAVTVQWSPKYSSQTFSETLYLCPTQDSIQVIGDYSGTPDTHLSGSLLALGLMGVGEKPMRSLFSGEVTIDGDTETGRQFQELFSKLDSNLEAKLARYLGENIAHNLAAFFQAGREWGKESLETFKLNTAEFLQEETRDLPAEPEMDSFCGQVDELRLAADRLLARVERLTTH